MIYIYDIYIYDIYIYDIYIYMIYILHDLSKILYIYYISENSRPIPLESPQNCLMFENFLWSRSWGHWPHQLPPSNFRDRTWSSPEAMVPSTHWFQFQIQMGLQMLFFKKKQIPSSVSKGKFHIYIYTLEVLGHLFY